MNVLDSRRDAIRKSLMFCMCFIFLCAMASHSREHNQSFAGLNGTRSNTKNASLRAGTGGKWATAVWDCAALRVYSIASRRPANRDVGLHETVLAEATLPTRKGIVLSPLEAEGRVNCIGQGAAKPKVVPMQALIRRISEGHASYLRIRMLGMNEDVEIVPEDVQPGKIDHFKGNDPPKWHTDIPVYKAALYRKAYPGIDTKFCANNSRLEYDTIVKLGVDTLKVNFEPAGANDVGVTKAGDLALELRNGRLANCNINSFPWIYSQPAWLAVS